MKEICITGREQGERLDRLLKRLLPEASKSFLYKMLRKKNITLNDTKADGSEKLQAGDRIKIWFSDETFEKFSGKNTGSEANADLELQYPYRELDILYEDENVVFINKPAGMLSQKAVDSDRSLCEYLIGYLLHTHKITEADLALCMPSVCNRLDRGTSGLVACGVSIRGLQELSSLIRERTVRKLYRCLVYGTIKHPGRWEDYLTKDEQSNTVSISGGPKTGAKKIITGFRPVGHGNSFGIPWTLLEVELITGRSHQIRAHMAHYKHPVLGDRRYGNMEINRKLRQAAGIDHQLLHAYQMQFPAGDNVLLSDLQITAPLERDFFKIWDGKSWQEEP